MIQRKRIGSIVTMTQDAVENYGAKWQGTKLIVTLISKNTSDHPGFDHGVGCVLYDLKRADSGEDLPMSLYDWELV